MKFYLALGILVLVATMIFVKNFSAQAAVPTSPLFSIQSIDTMKESRDLARSIIYDRSFDSRIADEMAMIASTGANYVAINTPYDPEFIPVLRRWTEAARAQNLHVWFRGNFSGWEQWFGYPPISRENHLQKLKTFLENNSDIFLDGDIFTSCPECENGGPGDPRRTSDVDGFRNFLINERDVAKQFFDSEGKKVEVGYFSMNLDVAKLIMDKKTTSALGGIVVIDDYVSSSAQLEKNIVDLNQASGGKIILGEFGAPIPDINGDMSELQQAEFIDSLIKVLYRHSDVVVGVNYWGLRGGSTAIVKENGEAKLAIEKIKKYYSAKYVQGTLRDDLNRVISDTSLLAYIYENHAGSKADDPAKLLVYPFHTDRNGGFGIFVPYQNATVAFQDPQSKYANSEVVSIEPLKEKKFLESTMVLTRLNFIEIIEKFFKF